MDWITTSTILRDLREFEQGDAWSTFVERFRRPIIAFARKMGISPDEAEDVAQESLTAFAEAFRNGKYDRDKGRLSQWLFGIAYNKSLRQRENYARKLQVERNTRGDPQSFFADIPDQASASNLWDQQWEEALLEECMRCAQQQVEPRTWRVFQLTVLEHRPAAEVAQTLGIAETTVYNAKHRVVKRLRELRKMLEETAGESEISPARRNT